LSEFAFLLFCVADPQSASKKITWDTEMYCSVVDKEPSVTFIPLLRSVPIPSFSLIPNPPTGLPEIGVPNQPFAASIAAARMSHLFVSVFIYAIVRLSLSMPDCPNHQILALVAIVWTPVYFACLYLPICASFVYQMWWSKIGLFAPK